MNAAFHTLSSSSLTSHPTSEHYVVWDADSVIKYATKCAVS